MRIGTKTLLCGVHQFIFHPYTVWRAWIALYGWVWDPRVLLAIIIHDWGYINKPNIDGREGLAHIHLGADIMFKLFGPDWGTWCRLHSRTWAKITKSAPSALCLADKLSIIYYPDYLYLLLARASGELDEYRDPTTHCVMLRGDFVDCAYTSDITFIRMLKKQLKNWVILNRYKVQLQYHP